MWKHFEVKSTQRKTCVLTRQGGKNLEGEHDLRGLPNQTGEGVSVEGEVIR